MWTKTHESKTNDNAHLVKYRFKIRERSPEEIHLQNGVNLVLKYEA